MMISLKKQKECERKLMIDQLKNLYTQLHLQFKTAQKGYVHFLA